MRASFFVAILGSFIPFCFRECEVFGSFGHSILGYDEQAVNKNLSIKIALNR